MTFASASPQKGFLQDAQEKIEFEEFEGFPVNKIKFKPPVLHDASPPDPKNKGVKMDEPRK